VLIFANPIAGRGRGASTARRLEGALRYAGYKPECVFDKPATAPIPHDRDPGEEVHAAISIGGDGTLRGVVSRLACYPQRCDHPPPPMLVIPTGTANLMGTNLGINWSNTDLERRVVETLGAYRLVPRDAATANGTLFLVVTGAGLDGQIIHELERRRTGPISLLSYALPSALSLRNWKYPPITVEADGRRIFGPEPGMAMVGNIKEHGIGFSFLPHAIPDDGLLDVLAFPCRDVFQGFEQLLAAASGHLVENEGTVYLTARKARIITTGEPVPVQADGEAAGFTPLEVELLPFQVPFLIPV
jgi:diacylglycerol kinase family enzyme